MAADTDAEITIEQEVEGGEEELAMELHWSND